MFRASDAALLSISELCDVGCILVYIQGFFGILLPSHPSCMLASGLHVQGCFKHSMRGLGFRACKFGLQDMSLRSQGLG